MMRARFIAATVVMLFGGLLRAGLPETPLAEGAWSTAVADADGDALRGRLVVYERPLVVGGRDGFPRQVRREVLVYLELQDAREFVGRPVRVFCDLGRTDPRHKGGLHCAMVDKDRKPVPTVPFVFAGGLPASQWVALPTDATIRVRTTPFGIHREDALAIAPTADALWVIGAGDANEYFLSGTFTADEDAAAGAGDKPADAGHAWRGTLELPAVRVAGPAAPDPVAGLVARLGATHGLWLNGVFPKLDAPLDAPVEQVLAEVLQKTTPPEGRVTEYNLIEQRGVTIPILADRRMGPREQYTAARVKTNVGEKIVLLQRSTTGWWSRTYAAAQ